MSCVLRLKASSLWLEGSLNRVAGNDHLSDNRNGRDPLKPKLDQKQITAPLDVNAYFTRVVKSTIGSQIQRSSYVRKMKLHSLPEKCLLGSSVINCDRRKGVVVNPHDLLASQPLRCLHRIGHSHCEMIS